MIKEIWKDIPDWEGYYQASNLGRVRSLDRIIVYSNGKIRTHYGKILRPRINKYGYQIVNLSKSERRETKTVGNCVYAAFYGRVPDGLQINHINENKTDNRLCNLNLMTPKENTNWGTRTERAAKRCSNTKKGRCTYQNNPNNSTIMEYDKFGNEICFWYSIKAAAEHHRKTYCAIFMNLNGKTKALKDGTYFRYYKRKEAV